MSSRRYTLRRRAARAALIFGALLQLFLLASLPLFAMDADAWRSLLSLFALVVISIGSAVALGRWPRASVIALEIGSVYATIIIAWTTIVSLRALSITAGPPDPARVASILLALASFGTIPIAMAIAWPLRQAAANIDASAEPTPDS